KIDGTTAPRDRRALILLHFRKQSVSRIIWIFLADGMQISEKTKGRRTAIDLAVKNVRTRTLLTKTTGALDNERSPMRCGSGNLYKAESTLPEVRRSQAYPTPLC